MNRPLAWRLRRKALLGWRLATAPMRRLPDFLIIGEMKCGTTSLYDMLAQHPDVHPALFKETLYFTQLRQHGLTWYRSRFPVRRGGITGEATPDYLMDPAVPTRVADALPDARFVAVLRDPRKRAWSHYHYSNRAERNDPRPAPPRDELSFEDAIAAEERRLAAAWPRHGIDHGAERTIRLRSYLRRGHYAEHLQRWQSIVGRERIHVLTVEELNARPDEVQRDLHRFLGLDPEPVHVERRNVHAKPDMPEATWQHLDAYFQPHDEALADWLGRPVPWR